MRQLLARYMRPTLTIFVLLLFALETVYLVRQFHQSNQLPYHYQNLEQQYVSSILRSEFIKYGSKLADVTVSPSALNATCVVIAAPQTRYKYTKAWLKRRRYEGVPFVLFESSSVRNDELPPHYGRIVALLAAQTALPNARYFAYSDIDAYVGFDALCEAAPKWPNVPMSISYLIHPKHLEVRTDWFILRPHHPNTHNFLITWLYNGRHVFLQDQWVLSELWKNKLWVKKDIHLIKFGTPLFKKIELAHCSSALKEHKRRECLRRSHLDV